MTKQCLMFLSSYPVSVTFQSFLLSASFQSFLSKSLYKSTGVALPSLRYRLNTMFYLSNCHTINLILIYPLWLDCQKTQKQSRKSLFFISHLKRNYKFFITILSSSRNQNTLLIAAIQPFNLLCRTTLNILNFRIFPHRFAHGHRLEIMQQDPTFYLMQ